MKNATKIISFAGAFLLAVMFASCGDQADGSCVEVWDMGDSATSWCGEDGVPPSYGDVCGLPRNTCFLPTESGSCELCSAEDIEAKVRTQIEADAKEAGRVIEHWEFGCMQDVERAKANGADEDYCCFRSMVWYEDYDPCNMP